MSRIGEFYIRVAEEAGLDIDGDPDGTFNRVGAAMEKVNQAQPEIDIFDDVVDMLIAEHTPSYAQ